MDSVVPRVKTISFGLRALRNSAVRTRARLVGGGGAVAQFVDAAMDVAVVVLVVMRDGVDDRPGPLAAGRAVEVDERLAVDLLVEDGKIAAERGPIDGGRLSVFGEVVHNRNELDWNLNLESFQIQGPLRLFRLFGGLNLASARIVSYVPRSMRTRIVALLVVSLISCVGAQAKPADSIDQDTVRKAITIFRRTPANQQGSMVRPIILRFAQESPDVEIVVSQKFLPWIGTGKVHEEAGAVLLTAYVAGNVQAQLDKKKTQDDPVAGTEQVIATYRQLQRSEPRLRITEVEKLIDLQRQGRLAKHLADEDGCTDALSPVCSTTPHGDRSDSRRNCRFARHPILRYTLRPMRWTNPLRSSLDLRRSHRPDGVLLGLLTPWLSLLGVLLILYTFYFFRDPERVVPTDPDVVVAAADGVIAGIEEVEEPEVVKATMKRVAIFLSVFDVHTNRAPVAGTVTYTERRVGKMLDARHPDATRLNECRVWAIEHQDHRPSSCARSPGRLPGASWPGRQVGQAVARGERFGMIRFGSRTEVYLPMSAEIVCKVGDRVQSGVTIIARLKA